MTEIVVDYKGIWVWFCDGCDKPQAPGRSDRCDDCGNLIGSNVYVPYGAMAIGDEKPEPVIFLGWKIYEMLPYWILKGALQVFDEEPVC